MCLGSSFPISFDLVLGLWIGTRPSRPYLLHCRVLHALQCLILIRKVSWVLPDISFFARCRTCRAVCWSIRNLTRCLHRCLPRLFSWLFLFMTLCFRLSLVWSWSTARCIMIVFTRLQALLSISWAVVSRGMESVFGSYSRSFFLLSFVLAAVFMRWGLLVR